MASTAMDDYTAVNFCFPAMNTSCTKHIRAQGEYVIMYLILFLISSSTVLLNLLVIISVSHFKQLHTPTNLLLLSLAVADLHVGLLVMPVEGIRLIESCWYFGDTFCYIFPVIVCAAVSTSLGNLVFISVDRYIAVCNPLNYYSYITLSKAAFCVFISWFVSLIYSLMILPSHLQSVPHRTCHGECVIILGFQWAICDLIVSFIAPCSTFICLYLRIFCVAKAQNHVMNLKNGDMTNSEKVKYRKSDNKAAKTLGILVAIYLLCWIPYNVSLLVYGSIPSSSTSVLVTFFIWTMYMNSCMNPLIYALFYPWFKVSAKHILTMAILDPASSYYNLYTD